MVVRRAEMNRYFKRLSPVLVAIEACGSSHHGARLLQSFGHVMKLIPPHYVKRTSGVAKTTRPMPQPFAKRSPNRACG